MHPPSTQSRFIQAFRRARSRLRGGHVVALSAVAVVAFGLVGLRAVALPEPRPVMEDGRLRIEVVHPVEPDIAPGAPMDVGELVDGFQGVPPPEPPIMDVLWSYADDWGNGADYDASPRAADRRRPEAADDYYRPAPERSSPTRALQRWFGFDAPRRDFQAERAARRARLEAMEQRDRERRDWERRRRERAEADRYVREGWRPVPRETPRWRDGGRDEAWRDERRPDRDQGPVPYEPHDDPGELNG